jgi:hypothetical protein
VVECGGDASSGAWWWGRRRRRVGWRISVNGDDDALRLEFWGCRKAGGNDELR